MDSHHPHQDGRVFTFVCGYMLLHKPTVVEMLSHITNHLSSKEAHHHRPPASALPAGVATVSSPKGTAAKAAARVAKVAEPTATEVQRKAAEKAMEATEAKVAAAAAEVAALPKPTELELKLADQAAEVEYDSGKEAEEGDDLMNGEEEEAVLEAEPKVRPRHLASAKRAPFVALAISRLC